MTPVALTERDILRFRTISDPQVSPDGHQVAFVLVEQDERADRPASSVWVVPADGSAEARRLTAGPRDSRPRWSPDGARLAFLGAREREWAADVHVLDMAGGEPRRLASLPRGVADYAWSPAGDCLCLVGGPDFPADPEREPPATPEEAHRRYLERVRHVQRFHYRLDGQGVLDDEARQLWVIDVAGGGEPRMLTEGDVDVQRPRWAPDGRIAFLSNREPDYDRHEVREVYAVPVAGGEVERLTAHGRFLSAFSFGPGGVLATLRTDAVDAFRGRHLRLWLGERCVTRELDRTSSPVVLADTVAAREPHDPVWAEGRYEEEFARSLLGAWGELDFPYQMALVDRVFEVGIADPERLGVGGTSYGGFSTLWAITHTDRFRAAVSMRPVAALESFYGSSDIGWSFGSASMDAEPWEDPARFARLSPLTHLDRVTTPLRLIAGTADLRTPAEQAENVFVRLRKMGREVDLVMFHGESHAMAVQGRPWNRVRHLRMVREWFERHLGPGGGE